MTVCRGGAGWLCERRPLNITRNVTLVLALSLIGFRSLGWVGISRFATWHVSAAHALAVMLVLTASAHFVPASVSAMPNHADLARMVPPFVPFPSAMVYATGVLEILGALGLVVGATRGAAVLSLTVLFVLLLPANIYAAVPAFPFMAVKRRPCGCAFRSRCSTSA
jgi:uncharacterized membrane protein